MEHPLEKTHWSFGGCLAEIGAVRYPYDCERSRTVESLPSQFRLYERQALWPAIQSAADGWFRIDNHLPE